MEQIMVTVCCTTYNQEKFIRRCLDSLVNQECSFKYEIIVHDDASTDRTASIVREYAEKYPDLVIPIIQNTNQFSQGVDVSSIVFNQAKGKYFAFCEGDDYWIDNHKLDKQVDIMEKNPDCVLCLYKVRGVNEDESFMGRMYPNFSIKTGKFTGEKLLDYICTNEYVFQTTSYFARIKAIQPYYDNLPLFRKVTATGDTPLLLYLSTVGKVFYIDEVMSCYRHTSLVNSPRRKQYETTEEKMVAHYNRQIRMMVEFDFYSDGKYHELCQRKIEGYYFDRAIRNQNYKEICKRKYSYYKKRWSLKEKIYVFLKAYFPMILSKKEK